jgi:hypothetical protein
MSEYYQRRPEEIEASIEKKRASLDRKIEELERRLSPREQLSRVRARLNPEAYTGVAAVGAVAAGTLMAVRGWRRYHRNGNGLDPVDDRLQIEELTTLQLCDDDDGSIG